MEFFKTKDECKFAAKILREAKKHLWVKKHNYDKICALSREKDYSEYICDSVGFAFNHAELPEKSKLKEWISYQLDGRYGLEKWLAHKNYLATTIFELMSDEDFLKLQRTRIAWMNWMIKELEAKAKRL